MPGGELSLRQLTLGIKCSKGVVGGGKGKGASERVEQWRVEKKNWPRGSPKRRDSKDSDTMGETMRQVQRHSQV
jgi:hypothetical protein